MKKILIINSSRQPAQTLKELFQGLTEKGFFLRILSTQDKILKQFSGDKVFTRKIFLGPKINNSSGAFFFFLLLPLLLFRHLFSLIYLKYKHKVVDVVCFSWNEKIVFTPLAKILRLKIIWVEKPSLNYIRASKFTIRLLKSLAVNTKIIVFTRDTRKKLEKLNFGKANIKNISPGLKTDFLKYQENIFSDLAKNFDSYSSQKYFTVGVINDLHKIHQLKNIFRALKLCLDSFRDIRLVIIGEGKEKKQVSWLAQQTEVENYVYLMGKQNYSGRWWENFDVYLTATNKFKLKNFDILLKAMFASLPVIAFQGEGVEEVVKNKKNGLLIPAGNPEILAEKIIKLKKDESLRKKLGEKGKKTVEENFLFKEQLERLSQEL